MVKRIWIIVLSMALGFAPASAVYAGEETELEDIEDDFELDNLSGRSRGLRDSILNVEIPSAVDFIIDPLDIKGNGSIYSEVYEIKNRSDFEVLLTLEDFEVTSENGIDLLQTASKIPDDSQGKQKQVYFTLEIMNPTEDVIVVTSGAAASATFTLDANGGENSTLMFKIAGGVNPNPESAWEDGDIRFDMRYRLETDFEFEPETISEPEPIEVIVDKEEPGEETETEPEDKEEPGEEIETEPEDGEEPGEEIETEPEDGEEPGEETETEPEDKEELDEETETEPEDGEESGEETETEPEDGEKPGEEIETEPEDVEEPDGDIKLGSDVNMEAGGTEGVEESLGDAEEPAGSVDEEQSE